MSEKWHDFIDSIKDNAGKLAKSELKELVHLAINDSENFIKEQGEKIENYLNQLAANEITKDQFEGYIKDIQKLTRMHKLEMTVAGKASAQRLVDGIEKLIINGLLNLI